MSDLRAALEKYRDSMVGPENIWPATMTPAMVAAQLDLFLAAHPDETTTEWGNPHIAVGFSFDGCSDRNPDICNCNTWTGEDCSICCEAIEDGQEIYSLTRRGNPALPDDDENQHWENFFKHAECPEAAS